jgi:hypothetical protein
MDGGQRGQNTWRSTLGKYINFVYSLTAEKTPILQITKEGQCIASYVEKIAEGNKEMSPALKEKLIDEVWTMTEKKGGPKRPVKSAAVAVQRALDSTEVGPKPVAPLSRLRPPTIPKSTDKSGRQ